MTVSIQLQTLVGRAQQGDRRAYGDVVKLTRSRAEAIAQAILQDPIGVQDVVQDAYLTAFRRLDSLRCAATFEPWLGQIVRNIALDRRRRKPWLPLTFEPEAPDPWTADERWRALEAAILRLRADERRLFERFYVGRWSTARIAEHWGLGESAVRKRLERIRRRLRKEIEMKPELNLSDRIVELLARPILTELPENPVGVVWQALQAALPDYEVVSLPDQVDVNRLADIFGVTAAQAIPYASFAADQPDHIIRADLTGPLLVSLAEPAARPGPRRVVAGGRVYRPEKVDAMHLEAFHQAEFLTIDHHQSPWSVMGWIGPFLEGLRPGLSLRIEPHNFPPLTQSAWEVSLQVNGVWIEVAAFGQFRDEITKALGYNPTQTTVVGGGLGLDRLAAIQYDIDDIRKISEVTLSPPQP